MKFITISNKFYKLVPHDKELLQKGTNRPHLLLLSLRYKGQKHFFAIPFRSNISPSTPKKQYFHLPPRKTTKPGYRHGLHYIKMFPVIPEFFCKFRMENNQEFHLYQQIIAKNIKEIVSAAQCYLTEYEEGQHPKFSVNIDYVIKNLSTHKHK